VADRHGLVQVYTGEGKGKTTAAIGLAVRAAGRGLRVFIVQFLKEGERGSGEERGLSRAMLPVIIKKYGEDLLGTVSEAKRARVKQRVLDGYLFMQQQIGYNKADVYIFDEISHAINLGLIDLSLVTNLLDKRPKNVEFVLTGRDMPKEILERADLITEMTNIKHPFDSKIPARNGIEY
jgi:cob(I)alamin adenosyltransferase